MHSEQISTESYANVIADLEAKRDELDRIIRTLKAMSQLEPPATPTIVSTKPEKMLPISRPSGRRRVSRSHYSAGLGEECVRILRDCVQTGAAISTRQVTDLLLESGFELKTANPTNNVFSSLNHRAKVSGDVERVGSNWRFVSPTKGAAPEDAQQMNGSWGRS
jgi:hypothetical protein